MRTRESINKTGANSLRFLYNTAVGRILLKPLICKPISSIAGWFLDTRLSKPFIKGFIKNNSIDMSDYEKREFCSFNDFFTRRVLPNARPISNSENAFISPCDARLTVFPITEDALFTIKGIDYTISDLLENDALAKQFTSGKILIFRLAVDNYHRYGWCADGKASATKRIKGKYHTVQPIAMRRFPIFRENAREYTVIETQSFKTIIQMEVGALMVGRICNLNCSPCNVTKGDEKGKFEFGGSTVIVLLQKDAVNLQDELLSNTQENFETNVKYGEMLNK